MQCHGLNVAYRDFVTLQKHYCHFWATLVESVFRQLVAPVALPHTISAIGSSLESVRCFLETNVLGPEKKTSSCQYFCLIFKYFLDLQNHV